VQQAALLREDHTLLVGRQPILRIAEPRWWLISIVKVGLWAFEGFSATDMKPKSLPTFPQTGAGKPQP
jgi:hypothetical protein